MSIHLRPQKGVPRPASNRTTYPPVGSRSAAHTRQALADRTASRHGEPQTGQSALRTTGAWRRLARQTSEQTGVAPESWTARRTSWPSSSAAPHTQHADRTRTGEALRSAPQRAHSRTRRTFAMYMASSIEPPRDGRGCEGDVQGGCTEGGPAGRRPLTGRMVPLSTVARFPARGGGGGGGGGSGDRARG